MATLVKKPMPLGGKYAYGIPKRMQESFRKGGKKYE